MSAHTQNVSAERNTTKTLVINALFIALTLAATAFINIRLPIPGNGGLIHLGNVPMFIAAMVYGKRTGAIAGAFGMALFDLLSGWTLWAPFTFVVVGLMGFTVGLLSEKLSMRPAIAHLIAIGAALVIKVAGYYVAEGVLYGNWIQPVGSIPGNIMQVVIAGIIVLPMVERLKKMAR